jgi:formylmethanofuran dehydrogenase subunit E
MMKEESSVSVTERVAYLKGLIEGMEIDTTSKEGKILAEVLGVLEDLAFSVTDLEEEAAEVNEELEEIYDEIDEMATDLYDIEDDYEDEEDDFSDDDLFEFVCPTCGEEIYVGESTLEEGGIKCPACGEDIEFDLSELEEENEAE